MDGCCSNNYKIILKYYVVKILFIMQLRKNKTIRLMQLVVKSKLSK